MAQGPTVLGTVWTHNTVLAPESLQSKYKGYMGRLFQKIGWYGVNLKVYSCSSQFSHLEKPQDLSTASSKD